MKIHDDLIFAAMLKEIVSRLLIPTEEPSTLTLPPGLSLVPKIENDLPPHQAPKLLSQSEANNKHYFII